MGPLTPGSRHRQHFFQMDELCPRRQGWATLLLLAGTHLRFHPPGDFSMRLQAQEGPPSSDERKPRPRDFPVTQPSPAMRHKSPARGFPSPRAITSPSGGPSAQGAVLLSSLGKPRGRQGLPGEAEKSSLSVPSPPSATGTKEEIKASGRVG